MNPYEYDRRQLSELRRQLGMTERNLERAKNRLAVISAYIYWQQQEEDEMQLIAILTVRCDELKAQIADIQARYREAA